jgi:hypothetical protein
VFGRGWRSRAAVPSRSSGCSPGWFDRWFVRAQSAVSAPEIFVGAGLNPDLLATRIEEGGLKPALRARTAVEMQLHEELRQRAGFETRPTWPWASRSRRRLQRATRVACRMARGSEGCQWSLRIDDACSTRRLCCKRALGRPQAIRAKKVSGDAVPGSSFSVEGSIGQLGGVSYYDRRATRPLVGLPCQLRQIGIAAARERSPGSQHLPRQLLGAFSRALQQRLAAFADVADTKPISSLWIDAFSCGCSHRYAP